MGVEGAWLYEPPRGWEASVKRALEEDLGTGDVSAGCLPPDLKVDFVIEAQAPGVACGVAIATWLLDEAKFCEGVRDGDPVEPGTLVLSGRGEAAFLLSRERTALNYLMHLGGVASLTRRYVDAIAGLPARIVDTRKTTPGNRALEKYAVRCGGGYNHRMGLYDGVMLKDNHIQAAGSIAEAVRLVRESAHHLLRVEVECETPEMVAQAISAGAEVVMLDNMDPATMQQVVKEYRGRALFEASGGVTLESVRQIAETGVDLVSVGALTHSAPALSLHMEVA